MSLSEEEDRILHEEFVRIFGPIQWTDPLEEVRADAARIALRGNYAEIRKAIRATAVCGEAFVSVKNGRIYGLEVDVKHTFWDEMGDRISGAWSRFVRGARWMRDEMIRRWIGAQWATRIAAFEARVGAIAMGVAGWAFFGAPVLMGVCVAAWVWSPSWAAVKWFLTWAILFGLATLAITLKKIVDADAKK